MLFCQVSHFSIIFFDTFHLQGINLVSMDPVEMLLKLDTTGKLT